MSAASTSTSRSSTVSSVGAPSTSSSFVKQQRQYHRRSIVVATGRRRSRMPSLLRASSSSSSSSSEEKNIAGSGYLPGTMASAEEVLMQVVDRRAFKPTSEECPFCRESPVKENGSKCVGVCRNPQNVPGPIFQPHEMQTVTDAVDLQLFSMRDCDVPRLQHGVQVMWEYAVEHGNMERSRYFGYSSDMYHFDHFLGKCLTRYDAFVRNTGHVVKNVSVMPDGRTRVDVQVFDKVGASSDWVFIMVKRTFGKYVNCWQSHRIVPADFAQIDDI